MPAEVKSPITLDSNVCPSSNKSSHSAMSLKLLRAVAMLSSTVLFLPFVSILFLTFECDADGEWTVNSQLTCYSGIHIAFVVVVTLLLPYFTLLSIFIAGIFFDRNLKSDSVNAQIHGKLTRLHQTIERV